MTDDRAWEKEHPDYLQMAMDHLIKLQRKKGLPDGFFLIPQFPPLFNHRPNEKVLWHSINDPAVWVSK